MKGSLLVKDFLDRKEYEVSAPAVVAASAALCIGRGFLVVTTCFGKFSNVLFILSSWQLSGGPVCWKGLGHCGICFCHGLLLEWIHRFLSLIVLKQYEVFSFPL